MRRWQGFIAVTFALGLCFSTSSVPTPLYPIYEMQWGLLPSQLSYIFTAYMLTVLTGLLCFGRLSDTLGRYPVIMLSLSLLLVGMALSALASGPGVLIIARAIVGFGNGLLMTASGLALVETHPERDPRVASITSSMAISLGFGIGAIVSGAVAQPGFAPLVVPYVLVFVLGSLAIGLVVRSRVQLQGPAGGRVPLSIRPQMALPARVRRPRFLLACVAGFANFTVGGLLGSLVPSLLVHQLPWKGPLAVGSVFLPMALACVVVQLGHRSVAPFRGLIFGVVSFFFSLLALVFGLVTHSVLALGLSVVLAGLGQGYTFMTSAVIAGMSADDNRRAANMSTFFFCSYIGATVPVIGVGLLGDKIGLLGAVISCCVLTATVLAGIAVQAFRDLKAGADRAEPLVARV